MKTLFMAATALVLTGSAHAYQTYPTDVDATTTATISIEPTIAITPPSNWTSEQVTLWEEQMRFHPGWSAEQRAAFETMMGIPPINWTAEQRALYQQHLSHIPSHWTAEQRAMFQTQIAGLRTPWMSATETASTTTTTTYAMAPASGRIVQPSNENPERDARGIAVISDPAVVPDGFNGSGTGMGGPLIDPATGKTIDAADDSYPPCTAAVTDNCIQLYERGVRATAAMGGPYEPADQASTTKPAESTSASTTTSTAKPASPEHSEHTGSASGTQTTQPDPTGTTKDDTVEPDL